MSVRVYSDYDPPPAVETICPEKTKTRQSEAAEADINVIMKRYEKTGLLPQSAVEAMYQDVSEVGDYRSALEVVRIGQEAFMQLPAQLRARFDNDPAAFVDFVSDPRNRPQLEEMGLVEKAPAGPVASPAPAGTP